ncbi:S41 family peptidase [Porticoccaceae bacterium LTM1]|nr:S41 family peptidase [Porticoccaceae bacterium LTM1]
MNSTHKLLILTFCLLGSACSNAFDSGRAWEELITTLKSDYAYLDRLNSEFDSLDSQFRTKALATTSKQEFIDVSQSFLRNFRDPHLNLGPMDKDDYIVYPTGSDIYAEVNGNTALVVDIKSGSDAFNNGLRTGMTIKEIDGLNIHEAIEIVTGLSIEKLSLAQKNYALNIALGGKRYQQRSLITATDEGQNHYSLAASYDSINKLNDGPAISFKDINGIGYIRFNNSLGNLETVTEFEEAIQALKKSRAFILDLRNTPSGGNTGVAEPILGYFTDTEKVYQCYQTQTPGHSYTEATLQKAIAKPQAFYIDKPFVVLAGRWTGSMGEGMTIGLDALGAKAVIGSPMADLLGGIKKVELKQSGAWLELRFERLYHINGSFREDFIPDTLLDAADTNTQGKDPALMTAIEILNKH